MSDNREPWFYVDEDLDSPGFVDPLTVAGFIVKRHSDYFEKGAKDPVWIPRVASLGWYALSHDKGIFATRAETDIVLNHMLGLFVVRTMTNKGMTHDDMGAGVARTSGRILTFIKKNQLPFVATITGLDKDPRPGRVTGLRPPDRVWNEGKFERRRQWNMGIGVPREP